MLVVLGAVGCAGEQRPDAPPPADTAASYRVPSADHDPPEAPDSVQVRTALEQLLRGDAASPAGASSWFSAATAGALRSVSVDSAGHAIVDFDNLRALIPNASSSAGSTALLAELNVAVFSVAAITSVEYRMNGSCDAFWEWLQYGCHTVLREDAPQE